MSGWPLRIASVAALGCLSLSGPAPMVASIFGILAILFPRPWGERNWNGGHGAAIVSAFIVGVAVGVVEGFAVFLAWLSVHRAWTGSGPADARVALLLDTLMVLLACVAAISPLLAPLLLAFSICAPIALSRSQGAEGRRLELGIAGSVTVLNLIFFALLPRMQAGMLADAGLVGRPAFPDDVQLGDDFAGRDDAELVLRLHAQTRAGTPVSGPFYIRGRTLDTFDGRRWTASGVVPISPSGPWNVVTDVVLEALEDNVIFGPPEILGVDGLPGAHLENAGWTFAGGGRKVRYIVHSRDVPLGAVLPRGHDWLELPPLDPAVATLIDAIAPGETDPRTLIGAFTAYLHSGFTYTEAPDPPIGDPLRWFLVESKTGHCEYYATALTVMLRARDVPARLATGFYSEETSAVDGWVNVRRGHAHAWVEVPVEGGWAVVDASPTGQLPAPSIGPFQAAAEAVETAWSKLVLDYDLEAQLDTLAVVGSAVVPSVQGDALRTRGRQGFVGFLISFAAVSAMGTFARLFIRWVSRERRPSGPVDATARALRDARRIAARRGWVIPPALPPLAGAEWLTTQAGEAAAPMTALAWLHYRARYGGEPVVGASAEVGRLLAEFRNLPYRPSPPNRGGR